MRRGRKRNRTPLIQLVPTSPPVAPVAPSGGQSDVARLLSRINAEYQAAQWGLSGLSHGSSTHEFITARMEHMEIAREQLVELVGDEMEATRLVVEQLSKDKPEEGKDT